MTLHVHQELTQGTNEWLAARRGIVTASVVGQLITHKRLTAFDYDCPDCGADALGPCFSKAKGKEGPIKSFHPARIDAAREDDALGPLEVADNDASQRLTATLTAERIAGWTDPTFVNNDMMRGTLAEPIARDLYSGLYQQAEEVGFMRRAEDDWQLGFSPDGVVGFDGLVEIKAPRAKGHVQTIVADEVPASHIAQCQAGLLVSGRKWLDYVSYCGGLPLFVKRVYPDPEWFDVITAACIKFEQDATQTINEYLARAAGMHPTERIDFDREVVI